MAEVYFEHSELNEDKYPELGKAVLKVVTALRVNNGDILVSPYLRRQHKGIGRGRKRPGEDHFLPEAQSQNLKRLYIASYVDKPDGGTMMDSHKAVDLIMGWATDEECGTKTSIGSVAVPPHAMKSGRPYRISAYTQESPSELQVIQSALAVGKSVLTVLGVSGPLVIATPQALLEAYQGKEYYAAISPRRS